MSRGMRWRGGVYRGMQMGSESAIEYGKTRILGRIPSLPITGGRILGNRVFRASAFTCTDLTGSMLTLA